MVLLGCDDEAQPAAQNPDLAQLPPPSLHDKVDVLFVMDDSAGTRWFHQELIRRFPEFLRAIDQASAGGHTASYHFGVVTSDLGAGMLPTSANCGRSKGAKLQSLGDTHSFSCQPPTGGVNFLEYDQFDGSSNAPPGQDLTTTIGCMLLVSVSESAATT